MHGIIGVIAGTPIDTQMGVDLLKRHDLTGIGFPLGKDPQEMSCLMILRGDVLTEKTVEAIGGLKAQGARAVLIYCNSLSAAIDLKKVRDSVGIPVITPLDVYTSVARRYQRVGVLAANCESTAGIEKVMQQANSSLFTLGVGILPAVYAVEAKTTPSELVEKVGLAKIVQGLVQAGAEAIILGCTHFPYFARELQALCPVSVIDPGEEMVSKVRECLG